MLNDPDDEPRPGFYARALSDEDRDLLEEAREIEGLDEEIAMLRVVLRKQFQKDPESKALSMHARTLVRTIAVRQHFSPRSSQDFADLLAQTLRSIGAQIAPWMIEGREDV